jgi:hypothetical protein
MFLQYIQGLSQSRLGTTNSALLRVEHSTLTAELISLNKLVDNFNLYELCNLPTCRVVSHTFPMNTNTAAVDILLPLLRI